MSRRGTTNSNVRGNTKDRLTCNSETGARLAARANKTQNPPPRRS